LDILTSLDIVTEGGCGSF